MESMTISDLLGNRGSDISDKSQTVNGSKDSGSLDVVAPPQMVTTTVESSEVALQQLLTIKITNCQTLSQAVAFIDNAAKSTMRLIREKRMANSRYFTFYNFN